MPSIDAMVDQSADDDVQLTRKVAKILDEARASNATHIRKLKELSSLKSHTGFFTSFSRALTPLFSFQRRMASCERVVKFVASFAAASCGDGGILEELLSFLLVAAAAANKTARFRACQVVSEVCLHRSRFWRC